jgi:hypothetical protein
VAVPSGWVDELSLFLGGNMPAIRIPVYTHNPIDFSLDPETAPAALEITEIIYTRDDCLKIIEGILEQLYNLLVDNPDFIMDEMLCILSKNDSIALDWYFSTQSQYTSVTLGIRNLTYLTQCCRLRFTIGNVCDPIISQMPRGA